MIEQGDIVLIPFPFSDLRSTKNRPVLVISCNRYNKISPDFLGMAVTSNPVDRPHGIPLRQKDLKTGQLKADSIIRADKIYSLSNDLVRRKFAKVSGTLMNRVFQEVDAVLGRSSQSSKEDGP